MTSAWMLTSRRLLSAAVLTAVAAASSTGCESDKGLTGMALPTLGPGDRVDGALVAFEGVVRIGSQGCLMVAITDSAGDGAERWAVWPTGAEEIYGAGPDASNGVLVDGQRYVKGDPITGTGRLVALEALPGGGRGGGYFNESGTYCGALDSGVLVIDDVQQPDDATSPG